MADERRFLPAPRAALREQALQLTRADEMAVMWAANRSAIDRSLGLPPIPAARRVSETRLKVTAEPSARVKASRSEAILGAPPLKLFRQAAALCAAPQPPPDAPGGGAQVSSASSSSDREAVGPSSGKTSGLPLRPSAPTGSATSGSVPRNPSTAGGSAASTFPRRPSAPMGSPVSVLPRKPS